MRRWAVPILAAGVFAMSALVQLNDPDPLRWVLVYGCAALLAALGPLGGVPIRWGRGLLAVLALVWGGWLLSGDLPALDMRILATDPTMKTPGVEHWREGLGLLLIALYHGVSAARSAR